MGVCGKELILQFQAFSFQINKNSRDGSSFHLIMYDVEFSIDQKSERKKLLYEVMCLPYQKLLFIARSEKIIFWFDEEYDMSTHRKIN